MGSRLLSMRILEHPEPSKKGASSIEIYKVCACLYNPQDTLCEKEEVLSAKIKEKRKKDQKKGKYLIRPCMTASKEVCECLSC